MEEVENGIATIGKKKSNPGYDGMFFDIIICRYLLEWKKGGK